MNAIIVGIGPALIAITIIMFAFCLRSWRRNGIACDELIFLPGTAHAEIAEQKDGDGVCRLPLNLRYGNLNQSSHHDDSPVSSDDGDVDSETQATSGSGLLGSSLQSSSGHPQTPLTSKLETFEIEENEMVPLTTLTDEEMMYSASSLWKSCQRSRSATKTSSQNDEQKSTQDTPSRANKEGLVAKQQFKGFLKMFSTLSRETNAYAPSGPIVASAALDLCMPVLLNFHMFMIFTHSDNAEEIQIPPQVLPLIFLSILMFRSFIPFGSRRRFWGTIHSAVAAPFYSVTFRDEIIGEVATSMVRPLQDIFFALFYYFSSMYGIFTGTAELEATGSKLEHNFVLHNIVLPTCAVLPLLCRFLQTLRQAYDEQRRWPHLGNAFKYLTASMVIFYGMTHSEEDRSGLWKYLFGICLLYQIWWDIVIDWQLLRISSKEEVDPCCCIPYFGRIRFRTRRLFKKDRTYWRIIVFNILFRFTWMLSFIPAYHLDWAGEIKHTLSVDLKTVVSFAASLTELLRRCCWVILRLEMETLKMTDDKYTYVGNNCSASSSRIQYRWFAPNETEQSTSQRSSMKWGAYRLFVKRLFCLELFLWFGAFIGLGLWGAAWV